MIGVLDVRELTKIFTLHGLEGKQIVGCEDVSLIVRAGSCLAITGTSGAGKSTVLKCLFRTYYPTRGGVLFRSSLGVVDLASAEDREILRLRRGQIGYVSQFLRVIPRVSAIDVVAEPAVLSGVPADEARRNAGAMLERLRLPAELWDALPANFSGGEKQRVNIARACLVPPRLLLVDEPTASLDAATKRDVVALLCDLKKKGVAIVSILHDREVVEHIADDVLLMEGGRVCRVTS